jgi:hypothetical protein
MIHNNIGSPHPSKVGGAKRQDCQLRGAGAPRRSQAEDRRRLGHISKQGKVLVIMNEVEIEEMVGSD